MRNAKVWLCAAFLVGVLTSSAVMTALQPSPAAADEKVLKSH